MYWQLDDLTPEQLASLDDETVARLKAKEAYERQFAEECAQEEGSDDRAVEAQFAEAPRERWDCESVLSLRSNGSNHPSQIAAEGSRQRRREPQDLVSLSNKTGLPLASVREGSGSESDGEDEGLQRLNLGAARQAGETADEKRARHAAVKEAKRAARQSKKELKGVFAAERKRAQRHAATNKGAKASVVCIA